MTLRVSFMSIQNSIKIYIYNKIDILTKKILHRCAVLGKKRTEARLNKGRARSLWGVTPILTLPLKAACDELIGIKARSWVLTTYGISSNFHVNLKKFTQIIQKNQYLYQPYCRLVLAWCLLRYDIFHYFYDRGFLVPSNFFGVHIEELEAIKLSGKRLYFYAYGADVRTRDKTLALGKWNFCISCPSPKSYCICDSQQFDNVLEMMRPYTTAFVTMGDMDVYVPDSYKIQYWPINTNKIKYVGVNRTNSTLKIIHAPNHTHFKGSHFLEDAIHSLRLQGMNIEYIRLHGVSNAQVLKAFSEADLIADQFIGGFYGYTALEAMAFGKPVLSYIGEGMNVPEGCPIINTNPTTIETTLRWCIDNRDALIEIGEKSREFIINNYSLEAIALQFSKLYLDTGCFPEKQTSIIKQYSHMLQNKLQTREI